VPERFTRDAIVKALQAVGDELTRKGIHGQIFVVGGAAMALAYSRRRITKDVDAVFEPKQAIYEAAAVVAEDLNLPEDWLNDAAKAFVPGPDGEPRPVPEIEGIEVSTASPRHMLAMKLLASRVGEDDEDIVLLLRECGMSSPDQALELLEQAYPRREPPPKTRLLLEALLESEQP
jgi:hypothetical protein